MTAPQEEAFFQRLAQATFRRNASLALAHARENAPYIQTTIKDLARELAAQKGRPALIVSAGPSLHRHGHIRTLKEEGFDGWIVAADGAMGHLLRQEVLPDFVLTVDPDPHRIIRWFGDPGLAERPPDDYYRRQDLDPELNEEEARKNEETIRLIDRYGPRIKLVISTSVTPEITRRALAAGMSLYWWTPLYDDFDDPQSVSRTLNRELKVPCMTTGGNVGSSGWVLAQAILKSDPVLLLGMDFSYAPGTDVYRTQYYDVLKEIYPEAPEKGLFQIHNPHLQETWLTDPAYYWYSLCFRRMLTAATGRTINCTEGGILFGPGIEWRSLREALGLLKGR